MKQALFTLLLAIAAVCTQAQNVGIGTTTPLARLHVADSSVVFTSPATLPAVPSNPPISGSGIRMMWYAPKAAFRVGGVSGTAWDKDNIGIGTFATGYDAKALGDYTTAINSGVAIGAYSAAMQLGTTYGDYATAMGYKTYANGHSTTVIGKFNDSIYARNYLPVNKENSLFIIGNGTSDLNRTNAMVVEESGQVGLGTNYPKAKLHVNSGNVVFTGTNPTLTAPYANIPVSGDGVRMMWYPDKAAFRVGALFTDPGYPSGGVFWNKDSIGIASIAVGFNTKAKGDFSVAMGEYSQAIGPGSVAIGQRNQANGENSFAIGSGSKSDGIYATAMGYLSSARGAVSTTLGASTVATNYASTAMGSSSTAAGYASTAMGSSTTAAGYASTVIGEFTVANGSISIAMGSGTKANGNVSTAMGGFTNANGQISTANGYYSVANGYASLVAGMYNDSILVRQTSVTTFTPLFIVGNGNSNADRTNAFVVLKNGNVAIGDNGSPVNKLHVTGSITNVGLGDNTGMMTLGYTSSYNLVMDQNDIQARLTGAASDLSLQRLGGNLMIGSGTADQKLSVNGNASKAGGGSWATFSDSRLKQNIVPYTDGLSSLLQIKPVRYHYNEASGYDEKQQYVGILAQELQQVSAYMVSESAIKKAPDGSGYLQVDNSAMTYMLINAVKEQQQQIEMQQKQMDELKKVNTLLTNRIEILEAKNRS